LVYESFWKGVEKQVRKSLDYSKWRLMGNSQRRAIRNVDRKGCAQEVSYKNS
jgi:hypothetical protein